MTATEPAAQPELIGRTWEYRFTAPRRGWPLTTWAPGAGTSRALGGQVQVREVRVTLTADGDGDPRVATLAARGRWVIQGRPAHETAWLRFRVPGRDYTGAPAIPPGPVTPWLAELGETALDALLRSEGKG